MPIYVRTITNNTKNGSEFPITVSDNIDTNVLDYSIYGGCSPTPEVFDIDALIDSGSLSWQMAAYNNETGDGIVPGWGNWMLSKGISNIDHRELKFIFTADIDSGVHICWLTNETSGNMGGIGSCIESTGSTWASDWHKSGSVFKPLNGTSYARPNIRRDANSAGTQPYNVKMVFFDYYNTQFLGDVTELGYVISFSVNGTKYDIVLDAPLRVALDGTDNADELNFANQQIIRRVDQNGNTLGTPQTASITLPEISLLAGEENTITFNTTITPKSMSLTYTGVEYKKVSKVLDNNGNEIASIVDNTGKQIYDNN